ncbi:hypothetical protein [Nocardioides sp.]|uniref:hypothetical protein n=1 Tax=Nocardioides sp. TaxID=35761 RepID=UPI003517940C
MSEQDQQPGAVLTLARYPETLAVVKLAAGADVPRWAESSSVFAVIASAEETALVCAGRNVPTKVPAMRHLTGFELLDGAHAASPGTLVALLAPVAELGVTAHALTTFSRLWVLVPADRADDVAEAWRRRGHDVAPAVPAG